MMLVFVRDVEVLIISSIGGAAASQLVVLLWAVVVSCVGGAQVPSLTTIHA